MSNSLNIASALSKKFAVSQEDAQTLYPILSNAITSAQPIEVSFQDLETCSTIFLRNLLGELYLSFGTRVDDFVKFAFEAGDEILPQQLERLRKRALNADVYQPIFEQAISQA